MQNVKEVKSKNCEKSIHEMTSIYFFSYFMENRINSIHRPSIVVTANLI